MPWRGCSVTEERLRFVARLIEGEGRSAVCREFGAKDLVTGKPKLSVWEGSRSRARATKSNREIRGTP
jgi:hypothetical protein